MSSVVEQPYDYKYYNAAAPATLTRPEGDPFQRESQTTLIETIYRHMSQRLTQGSTFTGQDLYQTFKSYNNTLLTQDLERVETELHSQDGHPQPLGRPRRADLDVASELSYAIARLIQPEDFDHFSNAQIHFTDNDLQFKQLSHIKRAQSRGRHYAIEEDEAGQKHLTFLIRRPDNQSTPTDTLELFSLLAVVELAKHKIKARIGKNPRKGVNGIRYNKPTFTVKSITAEGKEVVVTKNAYLDELSKFTGRPWTHDQVAHWALESNLELSVGKLPLSDLDHAPRLEETAVYHSVEQIKAKLAEKNLSVNSAILGNDFTYTLSVATGLLSPEDLALLNADPNIKDPLDQMNGTIKKDLLKPEEQDLVRRFGYLQYLNRYDGDNPHYNQLRDKIKSLYDQFQIPLFNATDTSLGDSVSVLDFSQISDSIIDNIPVESVRSLISQAKKAGHKILNFCYPLGDNTYTLVKSLKSILNIDKIGFYGKVGATLDYIEGHGVHSGAKVGRIVLPEESALNSGGSPISPFINKLAKQDILIIQTADETEVILQVDGVLLQTLEDIKLLREKILSGMIQIQNDHEVTINPKKIRILLDMESGHLQLASKETGQTIFACYYTSDNTKVPPSPADTSHGETIVTTLGQRGTLAVLLSALSVLHGIVNYDQLTQ